MGAAGLLGMMVDPVYEGGGMDSLSYALKYRKLAKADDQLRWLCPGIIHWYVMVFKNMD